MSKIAALEPLAWLHKDDSERAISDIQKSGAESDGGACASSVLPYSIPLGDLSLMEAYAAAKVREAQEWQPIETAPKDGRTIILGRAETEDCEAISVPGYWQEGFDDGIDYMGVGDGFVDINHQQFSGGRDWGTEKYRYEPNQPTHWRPLPLPPSE